MANSLESEAEENEKKNLKCSSSAPNKPRHVNSAGKNHNTPRSLGPTLRNKGVEIWKAIMFLMLGFYTERRKKVNPILSTIKTRQTFSLICLNLHFELA